MECTPEQVNELLDEIQTVVAAQVRAWLETLEAHPGPVGVAETETVVQAGIEAVGQQVMTAVLTQVSQQAHPQAPHCATCQRRLTMVRYQERYVQTLLGRIPVQRAIYRCGSCGTRTIPADAVLGIEASGLSRGVQEVVCLLATEVPFARTQALLERVAGIAVDDNTIQRLVTRVGTQLEEQQQTVVEQLWAEASPPPYEGEPPRRLYLSVDGTMIHTQDGWKEVKVAAFYETEMAYQPNAPAVPRAVRTSYVVSTAGVEAFARLVYAEGVRRGLHAAEEVVVLADGAAWIWNHIAAFCDDAVEILDYYHARQHLWQAAHARYGEGSAQAAAWVARMEALLCEEGASPFLAALWQATHEVEDAAHDVFVATLRYFTTHQDRLNYAALRQAGYLIGSGTVESACKRVIGARLKQAGMRWSRTGAQAVATLRATILSDRWDEVWPLLHAA